MAGWREALSLLREALEERAGPPARYRLHHAILCLIVLSEGMVSRASLAKRLNLGEGSVRSLLRRLRRAGLVEVIRAGCRLTDRGRKVLAELREVLVGPIPVDAGRLTVGERDAAVVVRGAASLVGSGLDVRDAALTAGAVGATTLVVGEGGLSIPSVPEVEVSLSITAELRSGDAVVLGTGEDRISAELGAIAGALRLLSKLF